MAIAFGRFGTFKRFLVSIFDNVVIESISIILHIKVRSVKEFFVFLKNKIIEAVTGRRPYQEEFDEGEKGYQVSFFLTKTRKNYLTRNFEGKMCGRPMCYFLHPQGENGDLKNRDGVSCPHHYQLF